MIVKPREITGSIEKAGERYVLRVKAKAVDGKAKQAVVELLAPHFDVPKTRVKLLRGTKSRYKLFEIIYKLNKKKDNQIY